MNSVGIFFWLEKPRQANQAPFLFSPPQQPHIILTPPPLSAPPLPPRWHARTRTKEIRRLFILLHVFASRIRSLLIAFPVLGQYACYLSLWLHEVAQCHLSVFEAPYLCTMGVDWPGFAQKVRVSGRNGVNLSSTSPRAQRGARHSVQIRHSGTEAVSSRPKQEKGRGRATKEGGSVWGFWRRENDRRDRSDELTDEQTTAIRAMPMPAPTMAVVVVVGTCRVPRAAIRTEGKMQLTGGGGRVPLTGAQCSRCRSGWTASRPSPGVDHVSLAAAKRGRVNGGEVG